EEGAERRERLRLARERVQRRGQAVARLDGEVPVAVVRQLAEQRRGERRHLRHAVLLAQQEELRGAALREQQLGAVTREAPLHEGERVPVLPERLQQPRRTGISCFRLLRGGGLRRERR